MGLACEHYNDNRAGLIVRFMPSDTSPEIYFDGDSVAAAMEHFHLYVENNEIYVKTDEAIAMETAGIATVEEASALREKIDGIISAYTDEEALENAILFPVWTAAKDYAVGDRLRWDGRLWKVLQVHTSQADWQPDTAPSLYAEILTGEDDPKEWVQPDSTNPYMTGDRVIFEGHIYESLIDNNVWSPSAYPAGWQRIE